MRIILKRDARKAIPKYNEIETLLKAASTHMILSKLDSVSFDQIREILKDNTIPDGHIHQVAQDLGLEVEVE